jgi:hypothetical protein
MAAASEQAALSVVHFGEGFPPLHLPGAEFFLDGAGLGGEQVSRGAENLAATDDLVAGDAGALKGSEAGGTVQCLMAVVRCMASSVFRAKLRRSRENAPLAVVRPLVPNESRPRSLGLVSERASGRSRIVVADDHACRAQSGFGGVR